MIRSILTKIAFVFLLATIFTACNKYEEGANYSLLTAKMRITNDWSSTSYSISSSFGTSTSNSSTLNIAKDGTFILATTIAPLSGTTTTGTWGFNSDKTQLLLTEGGTVDTWDIIKLKNKELKLTKVETLLGLEYISTIEFSGE